MATSQALGREPEGRVAVRDKQEGVRGDARGPTEHALREVEEAARVAAGELGGSEAHLMIVGHNPGLTEFAERISADRKIDNMPTCAIYTLEFDLEDWSELEWDSGVNAELDYPKNCW